MDISEEDLKRLEMPLLANLVNDYHQKFKVGISTEALRGYSQETIKRLETALETGVRDLQLETMASDVQFLDEDDD